MRRIEITFDCCHIRIGKRYRGVVDGIGGSVKRMVYQDVMVGETCRCAKDFIRLIKNKSTAFIIEELSTSVIKDAHVKLKNLFDSAKPIPNIQQLHSMAIIGVDELECKIYSNSAKKVIFSV